MVKSEEKAQKAPRVQWTNVDVETVSSRPRRPSLHRTNSNLSINSVHSRRGSIDPATAFPIAYRTVSFQIAESKGNNAAELQEAKHSATKDSLKEDFNQNQYAHILSELADVDWHTITHNDIYTRLSTSPQQGLSVEQAKRRLAEYDRNTPSPPLTHHFQAIFG